MKFRKGVFIVAYRKQGNKILYLLLKRKLHWKGWEFPKGGVESFEFKKSAAKRELKEETGESAIKIKTYPVSGKYNYDKEYKDCPGLTGQTYRLYSAEIKDKNIILDKKEHSAYKWVDFNTAWRTLTWPNQRICLNIVNKSIR